jgi:hypothetical protein
METKQFIDKCIDNGYEWSEGEHDNKKGYFIGSKQLDTTAHFTEDAIKNNEWAALNKQIIQGKDVCHVTRVVGYYSKVQNWNKSKIGELGDRHVGEYTVK